MIKLSEVTKEYRSNATVFSALNNVSLKIAQGEFVSILGPSGSGKSTLLYLMGGLDHSTRGVVEVAGNDLSKLKEKDLASYRGSKIGFVFQFFNLIPQASALDNVILPLIYTESKVNRVTRAKEVLTSLGLGGKLRRRPSELSGGEQQRVAIARALVNDPEIILADEPTGNLDSKTGAQIVDILEGLRRRGKTLVVVTHDELIASRADRIVRLRDGQII